MPGLIALNESRMREMQQNIEALVTVAQLRGSDLKY